jgi:hypothetical protein
MRSALHATVAAAGAVSGELAPWILRLQRHHERGGAEDHKRNSLGMKHE